MIEKLLPFIDDFESALKSCENAKASVDVEGLRKGMTLLHEKFTGILAREGLQKIEVKEGDAFDPFRHEAILREESRFGEGRIARVIKNGYLFNGRVLRHAVVGVSRGKGVEEKEDTKS